MTPGQADDGNSTESSRTQTETEDMVFRCLQRARGLEEAGQFGEHVQGGLTLQRRQHVEFLVAGLEELSAGHASLDASRPWLCYWILHSLALLDALPSEAMLNRVAEFLARCQDKDGGFAGGPGQMAHLAPTYAAINALTTIGTDYAYSIVDRQKLHRFLCSMKHPSGGFTMHQGGEVDVRGSYCGLIMRCQTYEGGLGGEPGNEAHGGYTFCAVAAMVLLGQVHRLDTVRLERWVLRRHMALEGGFSGRANKLVDGCYSFWQGGLLPLLMPLLSSRTHVLVSGEDDRTASGVRSGHEYPFDLEALQRYILSACQDPSGGLRDKPSLRRDYYHTCYCLSGLAVTQSLLLSNDPVLGGLSNKLLFTDAVLNVEKSKAQRALQHFNALPKLQG
eukprot:CAMPEP_0173125700 /NCGR_PEP_ID=MMETSP1102-20130122/56591_1 /TAXON_ID=49646 /ORGANISM="Geminigera sp., Strain Caron Lab Isolate" /LENGTH=390 /DNA_ID=CAMNT_0014034655 /DNA_START=8 /DNA_END=1180 /DNA_ORIENTATION=+